jgi:fructose-bisphosphate aldolase class I
VPAPPGGFHYTGGSTAQRRGNLGFDTEAAQHQRGQTVNPQQHEKVRSAEGFIAALDQSGGSTPKALRLYGIEENAYRGEPEMFDLIHAMRGRIISSPSFGGDRILGAILFEQTMERKIEGRGTADYLWSVKRVVPFLKVDQGLDADANGVQMMKAMPALDALLARARDHGIFGTKMRSVIKHASAAGIEGVVNQQFLVAEQILAAGLMPIIEPEVDIHASDKAAAEKLLKAAILDHLEGLGTKQVMLKLTLPSTDGFYADLVAHPRILRVVALSGGYAQDEANQRLARNHGVIASFSRALTEHLRAQQNDQQFDRQLDASIEAIFQASRG